MRQFVEQRPEPIAEQRVGAHQPTLHREIGGLLEALEILGDARTMRALRRSLRQAAAGKWLREAEVFGPE